MKAYYRVTGGPVTLPPGAVVAFCEEQAKRRAKMLDAKRDGLFQVLQTITLKPGEVFGLDSDTRLDKAALERLEELKKAEGKRELEAYGETLAARRAASTTSVVRTRRAPIADAAQIDPLQQRIAELEGRLIESEKAAAEVPALQQRIAELEQERGASAGDDPAAAGSDNPDAGGE